MEAASPRASSTRAVLAKLGKSSVSSTILEPLKKTRSPQQIVKKRDIYFDMIDQLVKQYAQKEHIAIHIPIAIRKESYKGYRIDDPEKNISRSPPFSKGKRERKELPVSGENEEKKYRQFSLKERIKTETVRSKYGSTIKVKSQLPPIARISQVGSEKAL
jgi:hypothetical protein